MLNWKSLKLAYEVKGLPFPKQALVLCVCSTNPLKTMWEKEKLLVTSNKCRLMECPSQPFLLLQ